MDPEVKKFHFIGIGGIGMSALARILLDKKIPVSGSDLSRSDNVQLLIEKGAQVQNTHAAAHICAGDTVVFNSQIAKNNPEYQAALALKCPLMHRSELLAHLMKEKQSLAVAGTHGKTTTSSLLTAVLIEAGYDPTFAVGGMLAGLNGRLGKGSFFVAEADESDGSFLNLPPQGAIITNVEAEHLDHYHTEEALHTAFRTFFTHVENRELLFYCGDDPLLPTLSAGKGFSYGFGSHNDLIIENFRQKGWHSFFDLSFEGKFYRDVEIALTGEHNALNGAAVFGLSLKLGVGEEHIRKALKTFCGVSRRCERRAERESILFIDDYGHHPTEIAKTLKAVKTAVQDRRLVVAFQPHRYTRTRDLLHEFSHAFEWGDALFVTDIYAAFEEPIEGIHAQKLVEEIHKVSTIPCTYVPKEHLVETISRELSPHDVLLTIGAGDITRLQSDLFKAWQSKKLKVGLLFGGLSCEHEISLRSCRFVASSLDPSLYEIHYFGIDKQGKWVVGEEAKKQLENPVVHSSDARPLLDPTITQELQQCDLFLPILHGTHGEDGTIQGFFEMLGKPYGGPDYRSAAICMDKALTKRLAEAGGVKTPKDITFGHLKWMEQKNELLNTIFTTLPFPLYIKPVHLGSSVGITRVASRDDLESAIDFAFRFDTQVIVEEGKVDCRELEFAVMGNTHGYEVIAPGPGEKLAEGSFVDYEKKYGTHCVKTTLHPDLPTPLLEKGKMLARRAYEAVGCTGMTRVDFLLDAAGEFWLFEMNPIPGLQPLSLFPKIWNREGVEARQLFDKLVILAFARHRNQKRHQRCL